MPLVPGIDDGSDDSTTDSDDGGLVPGADEVNDGNNSGGPIITWSTLPGIPSTLRNFVAEPVAFILGALFSVLIGGLETVLIAFLDAILFVYEGDTVGSTAGMLGFADIPRVVANTLGGVGGTAGNSVRLAIESFLEVMADVASAAGPAAPLLSGALLAAFIIAIAYALRFLYQLALDSINPL